MRTMHIMENMTQYVSSIDVHIKMLIDIAAPHRNPLLENPFSLFMKIPANKEKAIAATTGISIS